MQNRYLTALWGLSLMLLAMTGSQAQTVDTAKAGRDIAAQWQNSVINLSVVVNVKMTMMGKSETKENKSESIASIIDPSGLTVTSLSMLTGGEDLFSDSSEAASGGGEGDKFTTSTDIKSVKMILADGKELPAQVVFRDKDLDLAFIRPLKKPDAPLPALDLAQAGDPQLLERILCLTRLGPVADRGILISFGEINAVITKPRKFYVSISAEDIGAPIFALDGKLVGIFALRKQPGGARSSGISGSPVIPIIVPTSTIAALAKQAPEVEVKTPETVKKP